MRIANRVLQVLDARQMTPADLVEMTGLSCDTVQRLTRESWTPTLEVAARIAWAVEAPIGELFWIAPSEDAA